MATECKCPMCGTECIRETHSLKVSDRAVTFTPIKPTCAGCKHGLGGEGTGLVRCKCNNWPVSGCLVAGDFGCIYFEPKGGVMKCEVCGQSVEVSTGNEGTSCYIGKERDEALEEAACGLEAMHNGRKREANSVGSASCDCYKMAALHVRALKSKKGGGG